MSQSATARCIVVPFPDTQPPSADIDTDRLLELIRSIGHPDLRSYCYAQISGASSFEEVAAVIELVEEVTRKRA